VKQAVATLKESITAMEDAYRKNRRASYLAVVKLYSGNLLTAAKQYQRYLESGQPHSSMHQRWIQSGMGWMVRGSAQRVWYEYERLVSAAARVRWY
jgi:preprotein translocase subunit Sec63